MATLRELYEEALMERNPGNFTKGWSDVKRYINLVRKDPADRKIDGKAVLKNVPQFKGNPWHDSVTGKFSSPDGDIKLRGGSMSVGAGVGRNAKSDGKKWTNTADGAGRKSGSGKTFKTKYGRTKTARGPSPSRVLAHSGKTRGEGGSVKGYTAEKIRHLSNMWKKMKPAEKEERIQAMIAAAQGKETKKEQDRLKKAGKGTTAPARAAASKGRARKGGGRRGRAARAESYDAGSLFFNRLVEGLV